MNQKKVKTSLLLRLVMELFSNNHFMKSTMMVKKLFILLISLIPTILSAQSYNKLLKDWKSNPLPKHQSYEGQIDLWTVYLEDDQPKVTEKSKPIELPKYIQLKDSKEYESSDKILTHADPSDFQITDNGFLISVNRGEWGGELYWFSKNGKKNYHVDAGNYIQFITRSNDILVLEGLAHLGTSDGRIMQLIKKEDIWTAQKYLELPFAPQTACLDKEDNILIVTTKNIVSVDKNKQIKSIVSFDLWEDHSTSSSIIMHNNILYVGMLFGVYKYALDTGKSEWLTPY
ncbi:hypothetical protein LZQ00_10890 [Sphingobacterium sp. SRCM116780]|uniref:hypothetical protein n=1 Tax=Sphingobacterium sp. SRCM116780 TaxID=2907623 RepID=UPI001F382BAE|nr:hypothetical protein [Sphingobacterium sp. SRCM116780]UIR54782.1 hypothetical protein LZQ00_10890 [Sphingobacterium sp. SRCM116780]